MHPRSSAQPPQRHRLLTIDGLLAWAESGEALIDSRRTRRMVVGHGRARGATGTLRTRVTSNGFLPDYESSHDDVLGDQGCDQSVFGVAALLATFELRASECAAPQGERTQRVRRDLIRVSQVDFDE